jgi:hypothetical protein
MSALEHFSCLDELIQVLYQGVDKFVVLSSADDEAWTVSIGLEGPEGRWWQGKWEEDTVLNTLVSHLSARCLLINFSSGVSVVIIGT